jgi:hypothetical protein
VISGVNLLAVANFSQAFLHIEKIFLCVSLVSPPRLIETLAAYRDVATRMILTAI